MAVLAHRTCPPIVTLVALLGLTFALSPEHPAHTSQAMQLASVVVPVAPTDVIAPPHFRDARPWNGGGMVMGLPATHDRIARNALTDLLSGLFAALRGLAA